MSGFATAMTQYCDAQDMENLCHVCRRDMLTTRWLWDLSAQFFHTTTVQQDSVVTTPQPRASVASSTQGPTGRTIGQVLRLQSDPGPWYAYAQRRGLSLLRDWCTEYIPGGNNRRSVMFGIGYLDENGDETYAGVDLNWKRDLPPQDDLQHSLALANRVVVMDDLDPHVPLDIGIPWEEAWEHAHAVAHLGPQHVWNGCVTEVREVPITSAEASHFFLDWLIGMSPVLTFVWSNRQMGLANVAALWFALDLAPVIPLQCSAFLLHDGCQEHLRQQFGADRVTFQHV
jgi:hypothetical protein